MRLKIVFDTGVAKEIEYAGTFEQMLSNISTPNVTDGKTAYVTSVRLFGDIFVNTVHVLYIEKI